MTSASPSVTALILAGGDPQEPLARHYGVASKALIPLGGKPLVGYVCEALRAVPEVVHTVYIGQEAAELTPHYDLRCSPGKRYRDTIWSGVMGARTLGEPQAPEADLLLVTGDLLWLEPTELTAFIQAAQQHPQAGVVYPVMARATTEAAFPEQKRSYARLAEGELTGGSVALVRPWALEPLLDYAEKAYQARKNLLALAKLLGPSIMLRFVLRRLRVSDIERHITRALRYPVKALWCDGVTLALDIDELNDIPPDLRE